MSHLFGRDRELELIDAYLDALPGSPAMLLVEGEAGIGKTTLWQYALEGARRREYRTLVARPTRAEKALSFAALRDLLEPAVEEILPVLPAPQRRALEVALLLLAPAEGALPDQRAVGVALLGSLRALARASPLLIALDDVQWIDSPTLTTLQFAARRLDGEPVALLLARRLDDEQLPVSGGFELATQRLEIGALTLGAVHALVVDRLGTVLSRPALRRLHELSGGNPFYVLELAQALERGELTLEHGEPLPGDLSALVTTRIEALPDGTRTALGVAAAASQPTIALLDEVLPVDAVEALAPATQAAVVELEGTDVRFTHPLLASAAYALLAPDLRAELHRRLAAVATGIDERARHLAAAAEEPDEAIAAAVEQAAYSAFGRGAPTAAAELAAQACRLTPIGNEEELRRRALAEAEYRFEAGDPGTASSILAGLIADSPPGPFRSRLLSRQARLLHFGQDVTQGVDHLRRALAEAGEDGELRAEIEEGLAWGLLLMREDIPAAARHARSAAAFAEQRGDRAALAEALAVLGLTEFALGRDSNEPIERALALEAWTLHMRVLRHPSFAYGYLLSCSDELDRARAVFRELLARAAEHGDESALPLIFNHLLLIECLAGNWDAATAHASEGYSLAIQTGQPPPQASILAKQALLEARRGEIEGARETAGRSLALAGGPGFDVSQPRRALARGGETALWALGFLELSLGHAAEADRLLRPLAHVLLEAGIREPGELRCLPDAIESLIALGELDDADVLLAKLEGLARAVHRASAQGEAARCRGLLLAAQGDIAAALRSLEAARSHYEHVPLPFERARVLLVLGETQRRARQRRAGRETLTAALAVFDDLGAALWAEKTQAALARIGGRAPADGSLTPAEHRVAGLVAEGRSNKEVAATLFVSRKTVETQLSRIYAKLGIHSRGELRNRLDEDKE